MLVLLFRQSELPAFASNFFYISLNFLLKKALILCADNIQRRSYQSSLRHTRHIAKCCFLPDLTWFTRLSCTSSNIQHINIYYLHKIPAHFVAQSLYNNMINVASIFSCLNAIAIYSSIVSFSLSITGFSIS